MIRYTEAPKLARMEHGLSCILYPQSPSSLLVGIAIGGSVGTAAVCGGVVRASIAITIRVSVDVLVNFEHEGAVCLRRRHVLRVRLVGVLSHQWGPWTNL